jgi:hypothetical protein
MQITGLDLFGLNEGAFKRLGNRTVLVYAYLRTYDVTMAVRSLQPSKRFAYMTVRVGRWIDGLRRVYPKLSFRVHGGELSATHPLRWSQLPTTLSVRGSAREVSKLAGATAIRSMHLDKVTGRRRRRAQKSLPEWYCVRAFVVIRVERATSGLQNTEDRFILVRADSFEDAKKRIKRQWQQYATPYLNSEGRMVSWQLDRIVDVYQTSETDIAATGTEVYSRLGHRRMRPKYVWRPKLSR